MTTTPDGSPEHVLAARIADALIVDMAGRHGLGDEWDRVDRKVRGEVRAAWIDRVRGILESEPTTGARLIAAARLRQMDEEGYTPTHDAQHTDGSLAFAALGYLEQGVTPPIIGAGRGIILPSFWPWPARDFHPSPDPVRNFTKAGALLAAEIDRLRLADD